MWPSIRRPASVAEKTKTRTTMTKTTATTKTKTTTTTTTTLMKKKKKNAGNIIKIGGAPRKAKLKLNLTKVATRKNQEKEADLDSSLTKAVKTAKTLIQKKSLQQKGISNPKSLLPKGKKQKSKPLPTTKGKIKERIRGLVYIGHIPEGFFEDQMKDYFQQFGKVTRVRVARSKKTGRSKGYGYVEFLESDVAKIAAETMNNYLMCGRLLKAEYIPPEKQHTGYFAGQNWSERNYPALERQTKQLQRNEEPIGALKQKRTVKRLLRSVSTAQKKLREKGVELELRAVGGAVAGE